MFSSLLKDLDPFAIQKQDSYRVVLPQITSLVHFLLKLTHKPQRDTRMEFEHLLLVSVLISTCSSASHIIALTALPVGKQD